jgi:hypothetical protein
LFFYFCIIILLLGFFSKRSQGFLGNQDKFIMGRKSKAQKAAAANFQNQTKNSAERYSSKIAISNGSNTISSDGSEVLVVWSSSNSSSSSSSSSCARYFSL